MADFVILIWPLLAASFGAIVADHKPASVRLAVVLLSPFPALLQWYALIWYRQTYLDIHPMMELKVRAVTAGICQIQMVAAPVIVLLVLSIGWLSRRISLARQS